MKKIIFLLIIILITGNKFSFSRVDTTTSKIFYTNNIETYFDNKGNIGALFEIDTSGGFYNDKGFLFSAGFYLSGNCMNKVFANGVIRSSRIGDYIPGNVKKDTLSRYIYSVSSTDTPFSSSWLNWKNAVQFGAKFYDGNNDSIYNPVDINSNGLWDINEDKPTIIGDMTSWCVFNDGVETQLRRFIEQEPIGLEIYQTMFAFNKQNSYLDNFIFINYEVKNKTGLLCDSIIFSPVADFDLGDPGDDLVGSLKGYNSIYAYQKRSDKEFGINIPVAFLSVILGPMISFPNGSHNDKRYNNLYEIEGNYDLTQGYRLGTDFTLKSHAGFINSNNTSSNWYISADPTQGDPINIQEVRIYSLGLNRTSKPPSPCSSSIFGSVVGEDCNTINPFFFFSGDPFQNHGWLNSSPSDYRVQANSGIFSLEPDESQEILIAYHIGAGSSTEQGFINGKKDLDSLFADLGIIRYFPTSVQDNKSIEITNYELYNCYPNPFNPSTTIRYSVPQDNQVVIKVFDVLGNEVSTLVDDFVKKGSYEVKFDASNLASGMYFYNLKSGNFTASKKMILIK